MVNTAANWLTWQGYLLFLIGGKDGSWASANLGVIVALLVGLFGALAFQRGDIAKQEADLRHPKRRMPSKPSDERRDRTGRNIR